MTSLVSCDHLSFGYRPRKQVLHDLSFTLQPGLTALLGANGAGKSTLMRLLATELPLPKKATVHIAGLPLERKNLAEIRSRIGWVPQEFPFDRRQKVSDTVSLVARLRGVPRAKVGEAVSQALHHANLDNRANERLGNLSGGLRRRAVIAAGIVHSPGILLLDEPTAGLDPDNRADVIELLRDRADAGVATLMSTHLAADVEAADQVMFLRDGQIQHTAQVTDVLAEYGSIDAAFSVLSRGENS